MRIGLRRGRAGAGRGERQRVSWPAIRITVAALFTIGFGLAGFSLRPADENVPDPPTPSIQILTDRPGVSLSVTVSMFMDSKARSEIARRTSSGATTHFLSPPRPDNQIFLNIATTGRLTQPVNLVIELNGFPPTRAEGGLEGLTLLQPEIPKSQPRAGTFRAKSASTAAFPLHSYVISELMYPISSAPSIGGLALDSDYQTGTAVSATQIRLSLPVVNESSASDQGQPPSVPKGEPAADWFPDQLVPRSLHLPARLYQPALQFASESFYDFDIDSSNYEILSGDPPVIDEGTWSWRDTNDVTVLAENLTAQASEQTRTFWSGVLMGVAGAGLITVALEAIGAVQVRAEAAEAAEVGEPSVVVDDGAEL